MLDLRQALLLAISVMVPVVLIALNWRRTLVAWLGFTVCVNLFDTNVLINLPAARVAGLLLLPQSVAALPRLLRGLPTRLLVAQFALLVMVGLVFGVLFPWSSEGYVRLVTQQATGRAFVYLVRTAADLSVALFVARVVVDTGRPSEVVRALLRGAVIAAVGGLLELATHIDIYGGVTGLRALSLDRMRGFNFEPRGLGQICAEGMLLGLVAYAWQRRRSSAIAVVMASIGFVVSVSSSALAVLAVSLAAVAAAERKIRRPLLMLAAPLGLLAAVGMKWIAAFPLATVWMENLALRLAVGLGEFGQVDVLQAVGASMDIFDATALAFLQANPRYLLTGAGPGLISLPSTNYIPDNPLFVWAQQATEGINALPSMGIMLELANGGLLGLGLWVAVVACSIRSCRALQRRSQASAAEWGVATGAVVVGAAAYLVQASPLSAIWPMLVGLGLAAGYLAAPVPAVGSRTPKEKGLMLSAARVPAAEQ